MHRPRFLRNGPSRVRTRAAWAATLTTALGLGLSLSWGPAWAQHTAPMGTTTQLSLKAVFNAAWARQPEAQALAARREAALAQAQAARAWTPEPAALELTTKSNRPHPNPFRSEIEVGLSVPLWLPGERGLSQTLAEAEGKAIESHVTAAQLRLAASVRDLWWARQRAHAELDSALAQLQSMRRIAVDVGRRMAAGDLARADQHQADGAVAAAEAAWAQAVAAQQLASLQLLAVTAQQLTDKDLAPVASAASWEAEPEPAASSALPGGSSTHPHWLALQDRMAVLKGASAVALARSRSNPELTVSATREPASAWAFNRPTFTVGVRIPFGAGPRHDARVAVAQAEIIEIQAQLELEGARLTSELKGALSRVQATRAQLAAAERRTQLALESRGFFDKSFQLGQSDLPTRLRIEAEAAEAQRQGLRARIELAAAVSAWRQALGLLPQ